MFKDEIKNRRRGLTSLNVLIAAAVVIVAFPTLGSLLEPTRPQSSEAAAERTTALYNAKQIALGAIMYAGDADDVIPYVQQTASAVAVLQPYVKSQDLFNSPTKGGKFSLNLNVAGVNLSTIETPAQIPLWIESLPNPKLSVAVAFVDGHAKLIAPADLPAIKKAAAKKFKRTSSSKPLPFDYLLPKKP